MVKLYTSSVDQNLAGIVRHDLPKVCADKRKFDSFKELGQFTEKQAREALQPGFGPALLVSDLGPGVWGQYRAGDEIHINSVIVRQHQTILDTWASASIYHKRDHDRWLALVRRATLIIESSILHELVHWGDAKDGSERDRDAIMHGYKDVGHMFVIDAYGRQLGVEHERAGRRRLKLPKLDIEGWLGWGTVEVDGKLHAYAYDPWYGRGPGSGPPAPPR